MGGCSGKSTGREGQRPRPRTEGSVLSLAASPTLWDQHSNRGRVDRQPHGGGGAGGGTGSTNPRGGVGISWSLPGDGPGGGIGIPWSSPRDGPGEGVHIPWSFPILGEVSAFPGPPLGLVLQEALASPGPSQGWSWGRCRHPLVPPQEWPWGRHPLVLPLLGEVSASPSPGMHRKRGGKPDCRPRAPARDRAALRGAMSSSPPPLKPKPAEERRCGPGRGEAVSAFPTLFLACSVCPGLSSQLFKVKAGFSFPVPSIWHRQVCLPFVK